MASSGDDSNSDNQNSSWWGSFIKSAKEKSINALEMIKTDLAEFKTTMTNDTTTLLNQATTQLNNQSILNSLSSFSLINSANDNEDKSENSNTNFSSNNNRKQTKRSNNNKTSSIQDRYKQELEQLQSNEQTYLTDPANNQALFTGEWSDNFNPDAYKSQISDILIENSSMRLLYSQLVPAQISNNQFWSRYFFKVNQLEEEHKRRVKLLERAINDTPNEDKNDELDWDEEEDNNTNDNETVVTSKSENENKASSVIPTTDTNSNDESNSDKNVNDEPSIDTKPLEREDSNIDVISVENVQTILEKELSNASNNLDSEVNLKIEDSDEWEKVSDINVNDNKNTQVSNQNKNVNKEDKKDVSNKPDKKSNDANDWDDWE
jgi:hypothetical protein